MVEAASLYVHIPFCKKRCYYCDFNTVAGNDGQIEAYFNALNQEIIQVARKYASDTPIHTLYIGGGTPSHVNADLISKLMYNLKEQFNILPDSEISMEANPGTLSLKKLEVYRNSGINRLSLGVQSTNNEELARLGRIHNFEDVVHNISEARNAGFDNISLDLMFGLPGQTLNSWMQSLEKVTAMGVEHLSLYSLTIEEGTPFGEWVANGSLTIPDDDEMADQYTAAQVCLAEHGFEQYEISNWRKNDKEKDFASRHNCQYWLNLPYLGVGLGSHSCIAGQRLANSPSLGGYIQACITRPMGIHENFPACVEVNEIDEFTAMQETMMLGLRLIQQGVSKTVFTRRFGKKMEDVFGVEINDLIQVGLADWLDEDRFCLTERGVLLGNQAFMKFV
jgi:oxygen-independent coproporphyrinogen-3 oxidase